MIFDLLTLWLCKLVYVVLRKIGKHGAALPGLIAEKINPSLLGVLSRLPEGVIVISGTNGKTTTTHLAVQALRKSGKRVFTNHSGSNMTRGLLSSIIRFSSLRGALPYDVAVLEVDEAYASKLATVLKPRAAILTNVLRDQLDRFGEIDHTAELLFNLAKETSNLVIYNGQDKRLRKVETLSLAAKTVSFGFGPKLEKHFVNDDDWYGDERRGPAPTLDYSLTELGNISFKGGEAALRSSRLPGWHNQINLTAVFALLKELYAIEEPEIFSDLVPPYGRGEEVVIGNCTLTLQLVKNPAGFRSATDVKPTVPALIVVNDAIADSRDVSWLWDVDVTKLASRKTIYCSGTRAYDIAVRLKYSGINVVKINTEYIDIMDEIIRNNREAVVFLTYTSMLQIRTYLSKIVKARKVKT